MATVQIVGWEQGFKKVSCTQLLQQEADLNLLQAKRVTDRVLEGQIETVFVASSAQAEYLVAQLLALGAKASVRG